MPQELIFAKPEEIVQPKGGLVVEEAQDQDHVLGATGPEFDVLCEDGHWANYMPMSELQRNRYGDTFMCVSFSNNNIHEFISNKVFGETINMSDLFLGVGSGTIRGRGNSKRKVAEFKRTQGFVLEGDYPYLEDMTLDEAYKPLTDNLLKLGKKYLDRYTFNYKWLPDNSYMSLLAGLKYSPIQVDVLCSYPTNSDGYIVFDKNNPAYAHEVVVFDYEQGKCWWVFDSESMQYLKFDWSYPFGSPMIHAIKKNMKIEIYKEKGKSALAVRTYNEPSMILFSGGSVTGETLFKSLFGISKWSDLPIIEVDKFPYPPKHILNCSSYTG